MDENQSSRKLKIALILILSAFFLKGVFLAATFPIFQGPDEQTHYGSIQYAAEPKEKTWPIERLREKPDESDIRTYNLSEELKNAAVLSQFDEMRFKSYNSELFSDEGYDGVNEAQIKDSRWKRVIESRPFRGTSGSPIYYFLGSVIERGFSSQDIFFRLFSIRLLSVLLGMATILLIYLASRKSGLAGMASLLIAAIAAFQPMFSFVTSVVNPDSLLIFSFTLFIFAAVSLMKKGLNWIDGAILVLAIILGFGAKGTAVVLPVMAVPLLIYLIYKKLGISKLKFLSVLLLFLVIVGSTAYFAVPEKYLKKITVAGRQSEFSSLNESLTAYYQITRERILMAENTYWGSFGWLDATIPEKITQGILVVQVISALLLIVYLLVWVIRRDYLPGRIYFWFFFFMVLAVQGAVRFYDWRIFDTTGKIQIGTPGRYFLPSLLPFLILFLSGFAVLFKKKEHFELFLKIALLSMIILQFYAIGNVILPRYYL